MAETVELRIPEMDCAEEVAALEAELDRLDGVEGVVCEVLKRRAVVRYEPDEISLDDLFAAVARAGLRAELWGTNRREPEGAGEREINLRLILTIASGAFAFAGFLVHAVAAGGVQFAFGAGLGREHAPPLGTKMFAAAAIVTGCWFVAPRAWQAARRLRPDMNLLMVVAITGAAFIGEWFEAATVSFLFALSLLLESWSVEHARDAIAALMKLAPTEAVLLHQDGEQDALPGLDCPPRPHEHIVPAEQVPVGSRILVKPGATVPLDGKVVSGASAVNQAPITGESMPVPKEPGSQVFAGTINGDGALEVETTRAAGETTLSRIIRLVAQAQARRSRSEQWVNRFARYYTPIVMACAVVIWAAPPLLFGAPWAVWLYRALVLLVIACPCALVISTPVSVVSALAAAANQGVLIKGGLYLEMPSRLRAIALDKTGTLTRGEPEVLEVVPLNGHTEDELLARAAAMEARSEHPLARAIIAHATARDIFPEAAADYEAIKGKGATAAIGGRTFWIGSHRLLEEREQETPEVHDRLEEMAAAGASVVVVGNDRHVCGLIAVGDQVRPGAARAVRQLREAGVRHIVMLTGDNRATAEAIARQVEVDEVRAELLPEDKVAAVEDLVHRYRHVAMVGDGVNDAPAMARASLGVAMGAMGTDVALETADIALMSDDLSRFPWLVGLSRRTLSIIRQNITAALAVKAVFVALALVGRATLWAAIAADTGMSLLVVFNALRLLAPRTDG